MQTLQTQLAALKLNNVSQLDPYVTVDPNPEKGVRGPNITFKGANIHIVSGSGATNDNGNSTGLGNLIIGYDETPPDGLDPCDRGGSHNLVIGTSHKFTTLAFGGLVVGDSNVITSGLASVSGGANNTARGRQASCSGGVANIAGGDFTVVIGGTDITDNNAHSIAPQPPFP